MSIWRLVVREISHRKLNFALSLLSVSVAVGCFVGALRLLQGYERRTAEILWVQQAKVEEAIEGRRIQVTRAGAQLNDAMRRITKGLGFNIFILPDTQDLESFHLRGELTETMPESHVRRLAESRLVTINHLLPIVTKRFEWRGPLRKQTLILIGTRGEVPILHRDPKHPLQDPVEPGKVVVGYHIHAKQGLKRGDRITLLGREFQISDLHPQRNSIDDNTVWIDLRTAQKMLGLENLIHAIMALECNCSVQDRVGRIREEITELLPGTRVEQLRSKALARAESRTRAKKAAEAALAGEIESGRRQLEREKTRRATLGRQRALLASVLVPLVLLGSAFGIGLLTLVNVRGRALEIGILRAIGFRSGQIVRLFLAKAMLVGVLGAFLGYGIGVAVAGPWGGAAEATVLGFSPGLLGASLGVATLLVGLASWIPALLAARQEPADVLREG